MPLRIPLLVWVDDVPDGNGQLAGYARSLGITVVELTSTASAFTWLEANQGLGPNTAVSKALKLTFGCSRLSAEQRLCWSSAFHHGQCQDRAGSAGSAHASPAQRERGARHGALSSKQRVPSPDLGALWDDRIDAVHSALSRGWIDHLEVGGAAIH